MSCIIRTSLINDLPKIANLQRQFPNLYTGK
jgi:hypothetical protein